MLPDWLPLTISWQQGGLREFGFFLSLWALATYDDRDSKRQSILGRTTKCTESRSLKASGSNPQKGRERGGACARQLELTALRKVDPAMRPWSWESAAGEVRARLWSLWDTRAPELQLDFRVNAAVSLLLFCFFFPWLTMQYKTIYKAMLSNPELISSLQEE